MEAMGRRKLGSKQNSCFLSQLFSCSLQVNYAVMKSVVYQKLTMVSGFVKQAFDINLQGWDME